MKYLVRVLGMLVIPGAFSCGAAAITLSPDSVELAPGEEVAVQISKKRGKLVVTIPDPGVATGSIRDGALRVSGVAPGETSITVADKRGSDVVDVRVVDSGGGGDGDDGGGGGGGTGGGGYSLLGWNDLGMHCMDADYSVFAILPPYNNLHAQLVDRASGQLVTSGVTLTYEAVADPLGSINSTSAGKTNFWDYIVPLFGVGLPVNQGLAGKPMASHTPEALDYHPGNREYVAEGIPITPIDDDLHTNTYPLVKVVASDGSGNELASSRIVLPVSEEMSCRACHLSRNEGSAEEMAAMPAGGWVFDPDPERDYRLNVLKLHDQIAFASADAGIFSSALATMGYSTTGLLDTVDGGTPILCAGCHASNALPGTGLPGIAPLTESMHDFHAGVSDPTNGMPLDDSDNRSACYQCHPGSETRCLRGAMGSATEPDGSLTMQCQSCHGRMSVVGASGRVGWLDQPNCQACHHDGLREVSALDALDAPKHFSDTADTRFASNPDTPLAGFSLFRMSKGHGDLQCEACHGATHAVYPSSHDNDNLLSEDLQGHAGTISECAVCHDPVPLTVTGGPHGVHTFGQAWVKEHHDYTEGQETRCAYCHGADYRGSPMATIQEAVTFDIGDGRRHSYSPGDQVGCYDCHNGPFH